MSLAHYIFHGMAIWFFVTGAFKTIEFIVEYFADIFSLNSRTQAFQAIGMYSVFFLCLFFGLGLIYQWSL